MATVAGENPFVERRISERRRIAAGGLGAGLGAVARGGFEGLRVSWGGVWGGVLVSMGCLILLSALGVAVGVSAVDPSTTDSAQLARIAGVWGGVSLLISLFVGGMVSTRIGMVHDRTTGMYEGALVWVVSLLLMGAFAGSGLGLLPSMSFDMSEGRAAAWIGLVAMILSLIAAVWGAMSGRKRAAARVGQE